MDAPQPVTVVIPARDAEATIDAQLEAIARQDHAGTIEVVVVDNGSVDRTAERARSWADRLPGVRVVSGDERHSPGYARNLGIRAASSELVVLCDADDVVDRSWVRTMAAALEDADLVAGGLAAWSERDRAEGARAWPFVSGIDFLPGLSTASAGVRRTVWRAVGGFDEHLLTGEDLDFAWRVQLAGYRFVDCPGAFVFYRAPTSPGRRFRRSYRYGLSLPLLYRRYRGSGMGRRPIVRAVGRDAHLVVRSRRAFGHEDLWLEWWDEVGNSCGRLVGSIRARALFL